MTGTERILPLPANLVALLVQEILPPVLVSYRAVWSDDEIKIRRGRAYIRTVPAQAPGSRDDTVFRVAAWLRRNLDLNEGDARSLLHEMNASWPSPLPARDLERALKSARKNGKHSIGCADLAPMRSVATHARPAMTRWGGA